MTYVDDFADDHPRERTGYPYDATPDPNYCDDCGVRVDRHGSECGYELGDHAAGYFEAPVWGAP